MMPAMAVAITFFRPNRSLNLPHQPVVSAASTPWVIVMAVANWAVARWTSGDFRHFTGSRLG